jgi:hypothetical protein
MTSNTALVSSAQPSCPPTFAAQPPAPAASPPSLADLAAAIRERHGAVRRAARADAMAAGDALLAAKDQLRRKGGERWLSWLERECSLSERTAQVYMTLARNRAAIEAQIRSAADLPVEEQIGSTADFSIRDAMRLISDGVRSSRAGDRGRSRRRPRGGPPTSLDALAWWCAASLTSRRHLISSIGARALAEATPIEWSRRDDIGAASAAEVTRLNAYIEELQREIRRRDLTIAALQRRLSEAKLDGPDAIEPDDGLGIPTFLLRTA